MFGKLKLKLLGNSNKSTSRIMVQCRTLVNKDAVRRESIDGVEHIIVSSATLPDDIVMNGGLYPAEEIEKSFESLELTLAPIEHPQINGQFISANDPRAIHGFHAGVFNRNVRREGGRVYVDKYINVAEAMKTDRGKRLLDRIDELENNSDPRPIHTSVGVFVCPENLSEPQVNESGDEYTWIAREMVFDHDAILLDSVGAAQPHQGVGVAVNKDGAEFQVNQFDLDGKPAPPVSIAANQSFSEIHKSVAEALEKSAIEASWIEELFDDRVVFWSREDLFEVPFIIDDEGIATIVGVPLPVERNVTFTPKTNHSEGDAMKELMLKALADAGITVNADMSDAELLEKYSALMANQSDSDGEGASDENGIAEVVANAVASATQPLVDRIGQLEANESALADKAQNNMAEMIANSGKYPGLDVESIKHLPVEKLKEMAANCTPSYGLNPVINSGGAAPQGDAPADMPE